MTSSLLSQSNSRIGVLICGHGSRNRLAVQEFANLANSIQSKLAPIPIEYGYLEFARPVLKEALERLRLKNVERIIAIPAMLFAAGHAKNDIPALLNAYSLETGIRIDYGRELGINTLMIGAAGQRVQQACEQYPDLSLSQTLLVVVGRGSSDPDANSNVAKITRMLVEGIGFGWGETLYSGVTFPLVEPGLRHVVRLGFKKVIVFPYFLFSGVLVGRIRKYTNKVANDFPEIDFINAGYLNDHPLVVQTFIERIEEVLIGNNSMNCSLCKYRSNLLGFEKEVGLPQTSHHHHVEGISETCDLCEKECTGLCDLNESKSQSSIVHEHEHEHHPQYPHSDHPLGPVTLRSQK